VYYGGGGFTYNDVYHMPTAHRKFQLDKLIEVKKDKTKQTSKSQSAPTSIGPNYKKK